MIAEVALNIPLRRTFDYLLPPGEAGWIAPGQRVIVPFGSRVRAGVVVGLKAASELPPEKLKAILRPTDATDASGATEVAEAAALFSPELLDFTLWVAEYYFCGWGEVLEAALPSGMGARFRTFYRWRGDPPTPEALRGLSQPALALVTSSSEWSDAAWKRAIAVKSAQGHSAKGNSAMAGPAGAAQSTAGPAGAAQSTTDRNWLLRQLRPGGLVEAHHEYAGTKARHRMERWIAPGPETESPPVRRGKRETRKEIVLRILREEGEAPISRLKALMKDPGAVVRQLEAAGLVAVSERRIEHRGRLAAQSGPAPEPFLKLNPEQQAAWEAIAEAQTTGKYHGFLLEGVTGSGKTEVYLHAVRDALARGKGSLVLVPEIALTAAMVDRFRSRFGEEVALLHSGLNEGERFAEWNRVREGKARIVIGPRSALFAPLASLGLVIVDEEHDSSYKQEDAPRYNGRDAAMVRALRNGAVAVLGSATPSMEAERNVELGKLTRLHLPRRVEERPLPPVTLLDLRTTPRQQGCALFTKPLVHALRETLLRKEQAILFLNRRGFGTLVRCGACGEDMLCANCTITLTFHRSAGRLLCHRCDYNQPLPNACPACGAEALEMLGLGTERIEQEAAMMFPKARVLRMDSDTLRRRGELERMLTAIRERRYDIIIGTQVLSKGHDYPHITLVAAILADVSLNIPDFRAPERTFQILTQMAGRAGRGEQPGKVLIQTYNPEHYSLSHVRGHDTRAFAGQESGIRAGAHAPPYSSQALLWISATGHAEAEALAQRTMKHVRQTAPPSVRVLGPVEAPIRKLNNRYRWMVLLRAETIAPIHRALHSAFDGESPRLGPRERIAVDVDPYGLL